MPQQPDPSEHPAASSLRTCPFDASRVDELTTAEAQALFRALVREWPDVAASSAPLSVEPPDEKSATIERLLQDYLKLTADRDRLAQANAELTQLYIEAAECGSGHARIAELEAENARLARRVEALEADINSAIAAEREACAQVCERRSDSLLDNRQSTAGNEASKCAWAIRHRLSGSPLTGPAALTPETPNGN